MVGPVCNAEVLFVASPLSERNNHARDDFQTKSTEKNEISENGIISTEQKKQLMLLMLKENQ